MKNVNSRAALRNTTLKALVAIAAFGASSAHAATANVPASATIIPPVVVTEPADIRVGNIAAGALAGTVVLVMPALLPATAPTTLAPVINSTRTNVNAVAVGGLTCSVTVPCGVGSVQIAGLANAALATVTVPATVTLTGAGPSMILTTTKRYGPTLGAAGVITGATTLSATGTAYLILGGSLAVGTSALQTAGLYTGTAALTIDY
jgi:hypothetical protein